MSNPTTDSDRLPDDSIAKLEAALIKAARKLDVEPAALITALSGDGLSGLLVGGRAAMAALDRRKRQEGDQFADDGALELLRETFAALSNR